MQTITKEQFEAAKYSAAKLKPLADALAAVNDQSLGYNADAIQKLNDFCDFISTKLLEAGKIIARAQQQVADRDQALINAASLRYFQIDIDISAAKHQQQSLRNTYAAKVEELKKQQFSDTEIEKIIAPADPEIEALNVLIAELKAEKVRVADFLSDAPRYCTTLLTGTKVFEVAQMRAAFGITATRM